MVFQLSLMIVERNSQIQLETGRIFNVVSGSLNLGTENLTTVNYSHDQMDKDLDYSILTKD